MTVSEKCQQCGGELAKSDVPFGAGAICPRCLLGLGLSDPDMTEAAGPRRNPGTGNRFRAPDVDQLVGKFPNLEIQHLIGYGGMGAVYQARQIALDRKVALKILAPTLSNDEAFAQRFMREARTLARLAHPNIVMVFEFGKAAEFHYLLMEYVDGVNLRDAILEGKLGTSDALAIVPQICDALQYAHDEGVVHRDIKPENILIDLKGRVKIADFGLAKLVQPDADDLRLTGTQQILGTLNYMAPEQIEGRRQVDHRADIYSLGVVFYELLTGELPIGRFAVPSEKSGSPNGLDDVVLRTLEKEPDRRYQKASEIKTAIQDMPPGAGGPATSATAGLDAYPVEIVNAETVEPGIPMTGAWSGKDVPQSMPKSAFVAEPKAKGGQSPFNQPFGVGSQIRQLPPDFSLPFSIDQLYAGFASAFGIARLEGDDLLLEYEIRDDIFQTIKGKSRLVRIPVQQLASAKLVRGLTSDRIEFQAKSLAATDNVPNARSGGFVLKTRKLVREQSEMLVSVLQADINPRGSGAAMGSAYGQPTLLEKLVRPFQGILRWQPAGAPVSAVDVKSRFSGVRFWFTTVGVLNFLMMGGGLRSTIYHWCQDILRNLPDKVQTNLAWIDLAANPFSDKFVNAHNSWSLVMSIMLFVAAGKLDKLTAFPFVAFMCCVLLIPFYPAYLLLAPWALWCLLQMMRPSTIAAFEDCQPCDAGAGLKQPPGRLSKNGQRFISRFLLALGLLSVGVLVSAAMIATAVVRGPDLSAEVEVKASSTDLGSEEAQDSSTDTNEATAKDNESGSSSSTASAAGKEKLNDKGDEENE